MTRARERSRDGTRLDGRGGANCGVVALGAQVDMPRGEVHLRAHFGMRLGEIAEHAEEARLHDVGNRDAKVAADRVVGAAHAGFGLVDRVEYDGA